MYKAPVPQNGDEMGLKIIQTANQIKQEPTMIQAAIFSLVHRAHLCLDVNGNRFKHFA